MKEIKEKPTERAPKSDSAGKIPKAALKKAWTETKEKSRAKLRESTSAQGDGDYTTANDTGGMVTDTSHSAIQQNTDFTVQQSRKFARKQIEKYRERHTAEQVETSRAYTAGERGVGPKQARRGTLPDAEPRPHRGADLPHQRAKEKVDTAKTAPRDIRGVTQGQRQLRTAANETVRNVTTQAQVQTRTRQVQLAMQKAAANTRKTATAVRSAIRHFLASLRSLVTAIVTGISVALSIIIVISLVAFVSGSAYGIFFAANAPNENAISVQEALETLTGEYRDRLEEISNTIQHDRQDIVANDGVYFIRWQDVLAVFSSYVSGDEFGSSVASLEEEQVDKLREIMWEMHNKLIVNHAQIFTPALHDLYAAQKILDDKENQRQELNQQVHLLAKKLHNLSRLRERNCITAAQYWERCNPLERELTDVKNTISKAATNHPLLRTLAQTKQLAEHYTYLKPLTEFDEYEFKFSVNRVLVDSESCTFELKNGMKFKEIF